MSDFKPKIHQVQFRLGLRPRPRWGSLQRSPDFLAGFKEPVSQGNEKCLGMGGGRDGKGRRGGEGKGRLLRCIRARKLKFYKHLGMVKYSFRV